MKEWTKMSTPIFFYKCLPWVTTKPYLETIIKIEMFEKH